MITSINKDAKTLLSAIANISDRADVFPNSHCKQLIKHYGKSTDWTTVIKPSIQRDIYKVVLDFNSLLVKDFLTNPVYRLTIFYSNKTESMLINFNYRGRKVSLKRDKDGKITVAVFKSKVVDFFVHTQDIVRATNLASQRLGTLA